MYKSVCKSLGRTVHYNNFNFYLTDGFGRDSYISYDNGGYWKENLKGIIAKQKYPLNSKPILQSLGKLPPPVRYHSDGTGRDSYVVHRSGGLVKTFSPINQIPLSYYLRNSDTSPQHTTRMTFYTKRECQTNALLNKMQNDVVNRLFKKDKNRFVLLKGERNGKMLTKLNNNYNPVLRKSQSMQFAMSYTPSSSFKPFIVFSPSTKFKMRNAQGDMKTRYTTILQKSKQDC